MRAWVTGAGSGIGRALSKRLADDGWTVAVSARGADDLESLAAQAPGKIRPYPLDVTDEFAVTSSVATIEDQLGPIDLAVLNAGTYSRVSAQGFSTERFRQMVDVNLMGTVHCLGAVMPKMIARKSGHIAVVSSVSGYVGLPSAAAYGATKAALINMCEALYPELKSEGVALSLVTPGFVKTPLTAKNDFPMPFLMDLDKATDAFMAGLKARKFEISFPRRMRFSMGLLASLPRWLRFAVTRNMVRHD